MRAESETKEKSRVFVTTGVSLDKKLRVKRAPPHMPGYKKIKSPFADILS